MYLFLYCAVVLVNMYVCMYVCMWEWVRVCVRVSVRVCRGIYFVCVHVGWLHVFIHHIRLRCCIYIPTYKCNMFICMHACVHVSEYTYIYIYIQCAYTHVTTETHKWRFMHTHTHTHRKTNRFSPVIPIVEFRNVLDCCGHARKY